MKTTAAATTHPLPAEITALSSDLFTVTGEVNWVYSVVGAPEPECIEKRTPMAGLPGQSAQKNPRPHRIQYHCSRACE